MLNVIMVSVIMVSVIMVSVVILNVVLLIAIMLNVIMLRVAMLNVFILSVVMLSVVAPFFVLYHLFSRMTTELRRLPSYSNLSSVSKFLLRSFKDPQTILIEEKI